MSTATSLDEHGWSIIPSGLEPTNLQQLAESLFQREIAGTRSLLNNPLVKTTARKLLRTLVAADLLSPKAMAIQAIAFDKNPSTNWKVAWHQDLMFPLSHIPDENGFELPSRKGGIYYARPPLSILKALLAARIHLDDCDSTNGPLRVSPGTHRLKVVREKNVSEAVAEHGETECLAVRGDVLLMKPLLLHASSPATLPAHRRILHFVYCDTEPAISTPWHQTVGLRP